MDRSKVLRYGVTGGLVVLLLAIILVLASMLGDHNRTAKGIEEGFELIGTYQTALHPTDDPAVFESAGVQMTFTVGNEESGKVPWVVWKENNESALGDGFIKGTIDPNVYLLEDESGSKVGWAHLAYSNNKGEGTLYLQYDSYETSELSKVARVPGYFGGYSGK